MVSLIDPHHVLIIPTTYQDMVLAQAHEIHKIANCMFRLYRWTKKFVFGNDNTQIPIWVRLRCLPYVYFHHFLLQWISSLLGKFLRVHEKMFGMQMAVHAHTMSIWTYRSLFRLTFGYERINVFWQKLEYEGNNAFCTKCGLLGQVVGVCRKGQPKSQITTTQQRTNSFENLAAPKAKAKVEYRPNRSNAMEIPSTDRNISATIKPGTPVEVSNPPTQNSPDTGMDLSV